MASRKKENFTTTGTKTALEIPENHDVSVMIKNGVGTTLDLDIQVTLDDLDADTVDWAVPATLATITADSIITLEGPARGVRVDITTVTGGTGVSVTFLTSFRGG